MKILRSAAGYTGKEQMRNTKIMEELGARISQSV
jgi:hypothetical protein